MSTLAFPHPERPPTLIPDDHSNKIVIRTLLALLSPCVADPKNDGNFTFDGKSVTVPQGKPVAMTQFNNSSFWQSEYLVYQESQVRIRYLLTFKR